MHHNLGAVPENYRLISVITCNLNSRKSSCTRCDECFAMHLKDGKVVGQQSNTPHNMAELKRNADLVEKRHPTNLAIHPLVAGQHEKIPVIKSENLKDENAKLQREIEVLKGQVTLLEGLN